MLPPEQVSPGGGYKPGEPFPQPVNKPQKRRPHPLTALLLLPAPFNSPKMPSPSNIPR
jgi:hypothetical protein